MSETDARMSLSSSSINSTTGIGSILSIFLRVCWKCTIFLTGVAALAVAVLYVKQDSLLYFPTINGVPRRPSENPPRYRSPSEHSIPFETHRIPCADGTAIHSWFLYHPTDTRHLLPTVIFFHGNAGNIGLRLPNAAQMYHYLQVNVWLIEYRGYGDSDDATPNEIGLKMDAQAVWNYIHNKHSDANFKNSQIHQCVDVRKLFLFGRSLGGAVAFHLAQHSQSLHLKNPDAWPPLAGVIVENTFLSISDMVDHLMPYVAPFKSIVLRIGWDSAKIASTLRIPTLFLAGAKDTLVPHSHMLELYRIRKNADMEVISNKLAEKKDLVKIHIVRSGTHNETWMQGGKEYWMTFHSFLHEIVQNKGMTGVTPWDLTSSKSKEGLTSNDHGVPVLRKLSSTFTSSALTIADTLPGDIGDDGTSSFDKLEITMGGDDIGVTKISSVGNFIGIAKEATKSVLSVPGIGKNAAVSQMYKKRD